MRQQAKPFTVEVKKSRKSAGEAQPLFGFLHEPAATTAAAPQPDKLFRQADTNGHGPELDRVFGAARAAPEQPAKRILPDLTAKPVAPVVEEPPKARKPRATRPRTARKPKPVPVAVAEAPAKPEPVPVRLPAIRVRRRLKEDVGLSRAERWKRRLPRHAR